MKPQLHDLPGRSTAMELVREQALVHKPQSLPQSSSAAGQSFAAGAYESSGKVRIGRIFRSLASDFPGTCRRIWWRMPRLVLASSGMRREQLAVRSGIKQYQVDQQLGNHRFLLRRNVHRLEKGLIMWPRRPEFGADYIGVTVAAAVRVYGKTADSQGDAERHWVLAVLASFFDATRDSESGEIRSAHTVFRDCFGAGPEDADLSSPHRHAIDVQSAGVDIDALQRLAAGRRSVRWFTNRKVDRTLVDRAIAVASESPTACNRAPYRFEIIDSGPGVQEVAECAMGTGGYSHQIPSIVVVIGDLSAFFHERDRHLIYIDSSLAAMGFVLGLESQGIASCMINWPDIPERDARIRKLLGLADTDRVVMLIAYGYVDSERLAAFSAKGGIDEIRSFGRI